jgi:O-acetyl-ADP-ribose deacetylase (regulator of RNase III)
MPRKNPTKATAFFSSPFFIRFFAFCRIFIEIMSVRSVLVAVYTAYLSERDTHAVAGALRRLDEFLDRSDEKAARETLRNLLTTIDVDLPEDVCASVDGLLMQERKSTTVLPWQTLPFAMTSSHVALWRGDITLLQIDAIVNAANSQMLGCFKPGHKCIDNVIQDKAGPRLRMECRQIMQAQGHLEPTGQAKITHAYCLPCKHVIHTVGPICEDHVEKPRELASSYVSCLDLARSHGLRSIAFCCISTGVFGVRFRWVIRCFCLGVLIALLVSC